MPKVASLEAACIRRQRAAGENGQAELGLSGVEYIAMQVLQHSNQLVKCLSCAFAHYKPGESPEEALS